MLNKEDVSKYREQSRRAFEQRASTYDSSSMGRQARSIHPRVLEKLEQLEFDTILDVGCGTGTLLSLIRSKNSNATISGIDISPEMIKVAKGKLGEKADLRVGDSEELPWTESSFDVALSTQSFHHYPNPGKVLAEIKRVLKPNGHLIVADLWSPTPVRQIMNLLMRFTKDGDVRVYSEKEICRLVEGSGFKSIEWGVINSEAFILSAIK